MSNAAVHPAKVPAPVAERSPGYWQTVGRRFVRDPVALVAAAMILFLLLLAAFGPLLAPADPYGAAMLNRLKPIGTPGYLLGADELGRDMLSRLIVGARLSLFIGITPVLCAFVVGTVIGIVARTVRALVADILAQEFIVGLRAKGLTDLGIFMHVVKNAAPTALAVMGLQLGYLLGGSILIETVFSWPGAGFLLNSAIFQRDLPLLQGTILVLAMFFVLLNLIVDVVQSLLDPRIARG